MIAISETSDLQPDVNNVGTLQYWDLSIQSSKVVRELLDLLDKNPQIPGVLVLEQKKLVGLIPRERVYEKLGRPFGVELFLKISARQLFETIGTSSLILASDTPIDDAVKRALGRSNQSLYEPIVVAHLNGYRMISMYSLLMAQQDMMQNLYSEVQHLSTIDPLTLVNNRRGFFDAVKHLLGTVRYFDLEYAVMMIDIDVFKSVNDRYGHLVGDEVIRSVAQRIYSGIREKDILGRFGGEEFVVFLLDIPKQSALNLAERLCQDIASMFHPINGYQIRVTISIGISHAKGANSTLEQLLAKADQAVFVAKNLGRNKAILWDENLDQLPQRHLKFRSTKDMTGLQSDHPIDQTVQGLLRMLYLRDYETEAHTLRVSDMALLLAKKLGTSEEECEAIQIGSLLHDIGKIAIPDKILFKSGELTESEWAIMQKHPEYARDLLSPISYFQNSLEIPYCHHEHWNGKGYPRGLAGEEIPLFARIFTLADIWDALSSDRPYRAAWKQADVKDYLVKQSGIIFDPVLGPLFLECVDEFLKDNSFLSFH